MVNIIQIKRGGGDPPALSEGEFAFDTTDKRIYIGDGGTNHELTARASLWFGAESAYLPGVNPASSYETTASGVYAGWSYLAFDDTTSEHAIWRAPMPDYNGDDITITAFSKPAITPGGNVTLQYNILTIGLANSETFNTPTVVDTGENLSHSLSTSTLNTDVCITSITINPANVEADDMMVIELSRDVTSDNLSGDGHLLGILVEYVRT